MVLPSRDLPSNSAIATNGSVVLPSAERRDLDIVLYSSLASTKPKPKQISWDNLADMLSRHDERSEKDGPGWSAAIYRDGATRGNDGVEAITALVLDVDHREVLWSLLDGLEYFAHTTWKHHASDEHEGCKGRSDCPHWRIVLPLVRTVAANDWAEFRQRARFWLCPNSDEGAKDAPRFFWQPACRPGMPRDSRRGRGRWLDPKDLGRVPSEVPRRRVEPVSEVAASGERPGNRFEREADWCRDVLPDWTPVGVHGDNLLLRRPGSTNRHGATVSKQGQGVLYVFSSNAAPLEPDTAYSKFGAYAVIYHGGDFKAAARELAKRYGMDGERRRNGDAASTVRTVDAESLPTVRPLTEMGNAERLVVQYGNRLRYCHPWSSWLYYDGTRWTRDRVGKARNWAKETHRSLYAEADKLRDTARRQDTARWAAKCESSASVTATLKLAEVEDGIPILPEEMDTDPYELNVLNGTVDLRTGQLRKHEPLDYITKVAPVTFDPAAACPTFMAFIERILPDETVRAFVQRAIGYGLTGDTSAQSMFFFYGSGANGKSTLLAVIQEMIGGYAKQAAPELLVSRRGDRHPTELADLFGARLVASVEVDEGKRLAETLVKQMTGGDRMKARFMHGDFFEWEPTHKLFLAANHRPEIKGTDYAIWRRIHLVPFTTTIPEGERDAKLLEKLRAELPGILQWAIRGCLDWQQNGLGTPDAVRNATEEYRAEQDVLAAFIEDRCITTPDAWVPSGDLYSAYTSWCQANGQMPISTQQLGRRLRERGLSDGRSTVANKSVRIWKGLELSMLPESGDPDTIGGPDRSGRGFRHKPGQRISGGATGETASGSVRSEKVSGGSSPDGEGNRPPSNPSGIQIVDEAVQYDNP